MAALALSSNDRGDILTVDCAMNVVVKFVRFTALRFVQHRRSGYWRFLLVLLNQKIAPKFSHLPLNCEH